MDLSMFADASKFILIMIALIVMLNVAVYVIMKKFPELFISHSERLQHQLFARYNGVLSKYVSEWFDVRPADWPAFVAEYEATAVFNEYEPFTDSRMAPFKGRFYNITPEGFRVGSNQGPWPITSDHLNIFFFGGSTALNQGPDWTAVSSYLQQALDGRLDRPVRCYNFGRSAYFSTQEKILFSQLLLQGAKPDAAIFLDGLNDFYFYDGKPSIGGVLRQLYEEFIFDSVEETAARLGPRPRWRLLKRFILSLPLAKAFDLAARRLVEAAPDKDRPLYHIPSPIEEQALHTVIERYLGNKRQIEALGAAYGVQTIFAWQPCPAYKYNLSHHVALDEHFGLGGHVRSGQGYAVMADKIAEIDPGDNFIWLADMQEQENRPLYLDSVHYTAAFSRMIAERLAADITDRRLLAHPSAN